MTIVAPTVDGWKVVLGNLSYPIRYWNGTDTRFSVDDTGTVAMAGIELVAGSMGQFRVESTGQVSIYDNDLLLFVDTSDTVAAVALGPTGGLGVFRQPGISFGTGLIPRDTWLYRPAASTLQLDPASDFIWGTSEASRLDNGNGILLRERAIPGSPAANTVHLYAKDSGGTSRLFYKDDANVEHGPL